MKGRITKGIAALTACVGLATVMAAQTGKTTRDGVYTESQAQQGHDLYVSQCLTCHQANLEGKEQNPPLAGSDFTTKWAGLTMNYLFTQILTTMPATKPRSLTPEHVTELIAYILSANKYPAGKTPLPQTLEGLKAIQIATPQP